MLRIRRVLALTHFAGGTLLLAVAAVFAASALRVLPHMSSGTVWTNLPAALVLAAGYAVPLASFGIWLLVLGRWTWTDREHLRAALLLTHGPLLVFGVLASLAGWLALAAANRSTAAGGGLMSPVAALPLVFGVPALAMSGAGLALAFTLHRPEGGTS